MRIAVIIAAGGASSRFGKDKLSQDVGGRPLLVRTVEVFSRRDEVTSIVVAGAAHEFDQFRERYAATLGFHGAVVVKGGATARWESVRNALAAVPEDATHIAVHDAARPVVHDDLMKRLIEAAQHQRAVIPGVRVCDTIKQVGEEQLLNPGGENDIADAILGGEGRLEVFGRSVESTLDRSSLMLIQTPQIFAADLLKRAYAIEENLHNATDDASVIERFGESVFVIEGDPRNIKITTSADLDLVRSILKVPPPAERPVHKRF